MLEKYRWRQTRLLSVGADYADVKVMLVFTGYKWFLSFRAEGLRCVEEIRSEKGLTTLPLWKGHRKAKGDNVQENHWFWLYARHSQTAQTTKSRKSSVLLNYMFQHVFAVYIIYPRWCLRDETCWAEDSTVTILCTFERYVCTRNRSKCCGLQKEFKPGNLAAENSIALVHGF